MRPTRTFLGGVLFFALFGGSLLIGVQTVVADNDYGERNRYDDRDRYDDGDSGESGSSGSGLGWRVRYGHRTDVAPVSNSIYAKNCGECHFAFQPGWLPARSWQTMMDDLENHFGENAELDDQTRVNLTQYLIDNAANRVPGRYSRTMVKSVARSREPLRMTASRFFRYEHNEIPVHMVRDNPKVGSWSRCDACHTDAVKGDFDEHRVIIPGFGRWDN